MSKAKLFRRHARVQTDRAISRAFRVLPSHSRQTRVFRGLLAAARQRSSLLVPRAVRGERCRPIEALLNLSWVAAGHRHSIDSWPGASGSTLCIVASLARHLLARYPLPKFLASVWFGEDDADSRARRRWYIQHAAGRRFRDLRLPMTMTRRMESIFLGSPDHLTVAGAMRRAELLALGASPELVAAVLATRLGEHLENGRFWRTVMRFFVREARDLEPAMIGPIVDFLQAVRHERKQVIGLNGPVFLPPERPDFTMKGRTLRSVLHQVDDWHRSLGLATDAWFRWEASRYRPAVFEDPPPDDESPPVRWEFIELVSNADLRREGAALHHCVASYASLCVHGRSCIWSLRRRSRHGHPRSMLTIEIDPARRAIVQARGLRNRPAAGRPLQFLRTWANREHLQLRI